MSKRFGRNRRRKLEAELVTLEAELSTSEKRLEYAHTRRPELVIDECAECAEKARLLLTGFIITLKGEAL